VNPYDNDDKRYTQHIETDVQHDAEGVTRQQSVEVGHSLPTQQPGIPASVSIPSEPLTELSYSCLLIPRFVNHHLVGDIEHYLPKWMQQVCVSYGWRMEAIVVRPSYLHWIMSVPLNSNPARAMKLIRRYTSEKILADFPRFKRENIAGDFWAPGFHMGTGKEPLSLEVIQAFSRQTRIRQGVTYY